MPFPVNMIAVHMLKDQYEDFDEDLLYEINYLLV